MQNFAYVRATSVAEALHAVANGNGARSRFLAGGTTLVDLMKLGVMNAEQLIDITSIRELQTFTTTSTVELVFGALAKMSDVAADPTLLRAYPALAESLQKAASEQLRNVATVGGNLLQRTRCEYFRDTSYPCNKRSPGTGCAALEGLNRGHAMFGGSSSCIATYPGDFAVALAAFDARVDVVTRRGERTIALLDLHRLPGGTPQIDTVLAPDELIVRIRVPATSLGRASTFQKVRDRESYAFATVSCAAAVLVENGVVRDARIALGGVATKPWRARVAERSLIDEPLTRETAQRAGVLAFEDARPLKANVFKMSLGPKTVAEALLIAKERGEKCPPLSGQTFSVSGR
jgi:xanthine dehydrogenase YagS FAD-binding subunit